MPPVVTDLISRYGSQAVLISVIVWFWRSRDTLRDKNATLEAKISSLEERNSDFKGDARKEVDHLKSENLELKKTIEEKFSEEAVLSKYEFDQIGIPIHKTSKRPFCPACLQASMRREVPLGDSPGDEYLRCLVDRNHCFEKKNNNRRGYGVGNYEGDPWRQ